MHTPKISVIIPVYNAGIYLPERIESILNQTLKDIEIIIVLDCPTDGSDKVAESYSRKDERIKLIYNPANLHIGLSRNQGLKAATGEYISLVDHDDYCTPDMYEKMYSKAQQNQADIVVSNFYGITSTGKTQRFGFPQNYSDEAFQKESFAFLISGPCNHNPACSITSNFSVWTQLFKRQFLEKHHIVFQDNRKITFEDRLFLIETYFFAQKVNVIHKAFTYHRYHQSNSGSNYSYRSIELITNYLMYVHDFLNRQHILKKEYIHFADNILLSLYSGFRNEVKHKSLFKALRTLTPIRKNPAFQQALRYLYKKENLKYLKKYPVTKLSFLLLITLFGKKTD